MPLNNVYATIYLNDGTASWNISSYLLEVMTNVGKNRALDSFEPGGATITVKNFNREFDPLNTGSSLYGVVIPRASYIIIGNLNGVTNRRIFSGFVDDWNFSYDPSGQSIATISATEGTGLFARQNIFSTTFPAELAGARVQQILDDDGVNFVNPFAPALAPTIIYPGTRMLAQDSNCLGQNALTYLQNIERSEQGSFYYNIDGSLVFADASVGPSSFGMTTYRFFTDDGTAGAYPYVSIDITYSVELLYNKVVATSADGTNTAGGTDSESQSTYLTSELQVSDVLYNDNSQLTNLVSNMISKYSTPELRVNSVSVSLLSLDTAVQDTLLYNVAVNSFCKVKFTPNGVGSAIEKFVRVIGISHSITLNEHIITYSFESLRNPNLVLDDSEFGKLDYYSLGM